MQSVFSSINPAVDANQSFTVAEVLERTQRYVATLVKVSPQLQRDLTLRIAELYRQTAHYDQAIALADGVIGSAAPLSDARTIATAWVISARAATFKRDFDDAQRRLVQLHALLKKSVPEPDELYAQMANAEGNLANAVDRTQDGFARFTEGLRYLAATGQQNELLRAWLIEGQGHSSLDAGDLIAARGFLNTAGTIYRSLPIAIGEREFELSEPLSRIENGLGRSDIALTMIGRALPEMMARRGLNHPLTLLLLRNKAVALTRLGRFTEAEPVLQALREAPPPYREREKLYADLMAATTLLHRGRPDAAADALRDIIAQLPTGTQGTSRVQRLYGSALLSAGQLAASGEALHATEQLQRTELGQDHPDVLMTSVLLANWRIRSGDREGARSMLARVVPGLRAKRGDAHPLTLVGMSYFALLDPDGALGINGGASAAVLGERVRAELGWQAGALELASWLQKGSPLTEAQWLSLPVVF